MNFTRYILPVVTGAIMAMIFLLTGQHIIHNMYPALPVTEMQDVDILSAALRMIPARYYQLLLGNNIIAAYCGGLIATLIAKRESKLPAIVVGIVLTLSDLYNAINLPHPPWFAVLSLVVYLPFSYLGCLLVKKKSVAPVS